MGFMDPFYIALLLYCAAIVLAFVDLFIPSGGMLLILAALAAFASVLFGFRSSTGLGTWMLILVLSSIPAFAFAAIKIWPHTPIGKRVILPPPSPNAAQPSQSNDERENLVGTVVVAESPLMPTGQIRVRHRRFNAQAEDGIIEEGQTIEVIAIKERNLIVRLSSKSLTELPPAESIPAHEPKTPEDLLDLPANELGIDSLED